MEIIYATEELPKKVTKSVFLAGESIGSNLKIRSGAKVARRATYEVDCDTIVTASIDRINFEKPAYIGDIITMTATISSLGRSSIQIRVKVRRESVKGETEQICSATMAFVTIKDGSPVKHDLNFEKLSKSVSG